MVKADFRDQKKNNVLNKLETILTIGQTYPLKFKGPVFSLFSGVKNLVDKLILTYLSGSRPVKDSEKALWDPRWPEHCCPLLIIVDKFVQRRNQQAW